MLPVGTEVEYDGQIGFVKFASPEYKQMVICTHQWPEKDTGIMRQVCIVVYEERFDQVKLLKGNHSRD